MDSLVYGLILAIIAAFLVYLVRYTKRKGWDDDVGRRIERYNFVFALIGDTIRSLDETLYNELSQVVDRLNAMYQSENITAKELEALIEDVEDVLERAKELYQKSKQ